MDLTKLQFFEQMCKHAAKENGLQNLFEFMIESMPVAKRSEFLTANPGNKGNGYRSDSTYGHGRKLEFRIPRDSYGNFHPRILAILRNQEEEYDRLAGVLYTKGLTQEQVGDIFSRFTVCTIQNQASAVWLNMSVPRSMNGSKGAWRPIIR